MYIAENVENKLWDTYSLPYTHAKKPIFKPMTELVSKRKGTKRFSKMNISEKKKESTAVASSSIKLRNADDVMNCHDSRYACDCSVKDGTNNTKAFEKES